MLSILLSDGSTDADALAWARAVGANGGAVSTARLRETSTTIRGMKAVGSWALHDDVWQLVADSLVQALVSLKRRVLATAVNSPVFVARGGLTFDGTASYVDTGFVPATHAAAMTATNNRLAVYVRSNQASNGYAAGVSQSSQRNQRIRPRVAGGTTATCESNTAGGTFTLPASDARGLTAASRNGGDTSTVLAYRNGMAMVRSIDATVFPATLGSSALFIGAQNLTGSMNAPIACTVGLVTFGASLSADQELAEYGVIQASMTRQGAAV